MARRFFLTIILPLLFLAACTDVRIDNPYAATPQISVVRCDVLFDSEGGEGLIEVACDKDFQVSCAAPWVSCSISGKTVKVKVDPWTKVNGRAATVLLSCGEDVAKAVIQQNGYVITDELPGVIEVGDEAAVLTYAFDAPYTISASSGDDWIGVEIVDQTSVVVTLAENQTGWKRTGVIHVSYSDPDEADREVTVTQFNFQQLEGEYELTFKDMDNVSSKEIGEMKMDPVTRKVTFTLHYTTQRGKDFDVVFPLVFSAADMTLSILGGELIGMVDGTYLFSGPVAADDKMTYGHGVGMIGKIERTVMSFGTGYTCKFEDNGVWQDNKAIAFSIATFKSSRFASNYYNGSYRIFKYPTLSRFVLKE